MLALLVLLLVLVLLSLLSLLCSVVRLNVQRWSEHVVSSKFLLPNVLRATTPCTFSTSQHPNVLRTCGVFSILTSKCASRHDRAHFFCIRTSKSDPSMLCLRHFYFQTVLPRHNAVHMFIISISRPSIFFTFFTSKNASRHSGAGFFDISISKNASKLRCFVFSDLEMCLVPQRRATFQTSRFSEPTFRPSGATNHWKNVAFRDFSTFSRTCIFFLLILSLVLSSFIFFLSSFSFLFFLSSFFFLLSPFFFLLSPLFFLLFSFFFSLPFPSLLFSSLL